MQTDSEAARVRSRPDHPVVVDDGDVIDHPTWPE
jgi:hypothetical protein